MSLHIPQQIKPALKLLLFFSLLTGIIYPALITVFAQLIFPWRANGSLIQQNGVYIGSTLLGQAFTDPKYFIGRPSATTPYPYNAASSAGSNYGVINPAFLTSVKERIAQQHKINPKNSDLVPVDLVTASASGLDPDISPLAAFYQVARIAALRHIPEIDLQILVQNSIQYRTLGILGEPRVNVLALNQALDARSHHAR